MGDDLSAIMGFAEQKDLGRQMCGYAVLRPSVDGGGVLDDQHTAADGQGLIRNATPKWPLVH